MKDLAPLLAVMDPPDGQRVPLPDELEQFYGPLRFPEPGDRAYIITNFVSTLDGVVSLSTPGHEGGGDISGFYPPDQAVMGILRACADAVIVGASQLRRPPGTIWLPGSIYPRFDPAYQELRRRMGKPAQPLQVVVTSTGELDLSLPIFQEQRAPVLILTSEAGQLVLAQRNAPAHLDIRAVSGTGRLSARQITDEIGQVLPGGLYLIEGGPHLVRYFLEERCLDELFLTVAPQIAGRDMTLLRPGFTIGKTFAPQDPRWGQLWSLKLSGDYLFLRYRLDNGYTNLIGETV